MKKFFLLALAAGFVSFAHADVLYNNLTGAFNVGYFDVDGGSDDNGLNFGGQVAQLITDTNDTAITGIEARYVGYAQSSQATALLAQVYSFSNGSAGSLVASQTITSFSEQDFSVSGGSLAGDNEYDVATNVNLAGLQAGKQYLVALQIQSGNVSFAGFIQDGNPDGYVRDFSSFGYNGVYGTTQWAELGAHDGNSSLSGDLAMEVTGIAAPEPATMALLGMGVVGLVRRRRAR